MLDYHIAFRAEAGGPAVQIAIHLTGDVGVQPEDLRHSVDVKRAGDEDARPRRYRGILTRLDSNFDQAAAPVDMPGTDPILNPAYTLQSTATTDLDGGIIERTLNFSAISGPVQIEETPIDGTLVVFDGTVPLAVLKTPDNYRNLQLNTSWRCIRRPFFSCACRGVHHGFNNLISPTMPEQAIRNARQPPEFMVQHQVATSPVALFGHACRAPSPPGSVKMQGIAEFRDEFCGMTAQYFRRLILLSR